MKEFSLVTEILSEEYFILDEGSITEEIMFSEREDLISNEYLNAQASFSGKKILMQNQEHELSSIEDEERNESKEVTKGWSPDGTFEEALKE